MKYSENYGSAELLEEYSTEAIITDDDAAKNNIDVRKKKKKYGCYYTG